MAEMSPGSASGRRATASKSSSSSGRSSLTGKRPSLPKALGTAAVRVVVKRLPRIKLSTLERESARTVAATRIQAAARGMLVRRRLPVSGYLQLRGTRFPYMWRRRFVSLELSTATLTWCRHPTRRRLGTAVVRGCARSGERALALRCSSASSANRRGSGERQLRLRATSAGSAEEWARALARAAATVAMAARANDGDGGSTPASAAAPFVPSAVVPRLEEVGLAIRLVGRKPADFALGRGQLHLHVRGAEFWKALEGVVPAAALRVARATLLPLPLIPDYMPASAFVAGSEAVDATLLLRKGDKPKAKSTAKLLDKLRAKGDPPLTLELVYKGTRGEYGSRGVLLAVETTPGKLLDAAREGHSLIGSGGGGGGGGSAPAAALSLLKATAASGTGAATGASAATPPESPARSPLRGLRRGTSSRGGGAEPQPAVGSGQGGRPGSRPPSPVAPPAI